MSLYSMRSTHSGYRIVKFDDLLNVEAVYEMQAIEGETACSCFQAKRPTCRHRKMFEVFYLNGKIDTGWFLDYDNQEWIAPLALEPQERIRRI